MNKTASELDVQRQYCTKVKLSCLDAREERLDVWLKKKRCIDMMGIMYMI